MFLFIPAFVLGDLWRGVESFEGQPKGDRVDNHLAGLSELFMSHGVTPGESDRVAATALKKLKGFEYFEYPRHHPIWQKG